MAYWDHILSDVVTVAPFTGTNASGDPSFGAQVTYPARVEHGLLLFRTPDGNEVQSTHVVVTSTEIDRRSRVWLPGDDTADTAEARHAVDVRKAPQPTPGGSTLYETRF